ncbi:MAG: UDP-N-acetylmuramate:L-alanyl-gamma-D-glutamyl-meso-diaminopimelate ligase, partial [Deltaproteobacteria bacterium]|nr:UDP-N-acetylmuramate:L-alanyl-gamma-D-glutamyl-meso-diaminopimelate ligase [Deltaproteobacteria bacterium]
MDLMKNRIPDKVKKVHLIAVCGTGMGALAAMLKELNFQVTGSDRNVYPPMSTFLRQKDISIKDGFSGENIAYGPDLVVVGNTIKKDNPEVKKMQEMGLHYCSMPQAINRFVAGGKKPILVAGTHGKTTTSSIMAWVLFCAGLDPSFFIGGILRDFSGNYRLGKGEHIVIEGDEYDTAYFDKGPKFLHYEPSIGILTGIEFDHADIFSDIDHMKAAFGEFISRLPSTSTLLAFDGDENVSELIQNSRCRVVRYGMNADSDWRLGAESIEPPWTNFEVFKKGRAFGTFKTRLVGEHNRINALSVIAAADAMKIPGEVITESLASFSGIKKRQEVRGVKKEV